MSKPGGIDDNKMVYVRIYDPLALGEEAKDKFSLLAYKLDKLAQIEFAELAQEQNLAKFTKTFNELIQIISEFGPAVNSPLTDEIAFYSDALRKLDAAVQEDDALFFAELNEARTLAKRILKNFLINPIEKTTEPEPEISKPRLRVVEMLAKLIPGLRSDDK